MRHSPPASSQKTQRDENRSTNWKKTLNLDWKDINFIFSSLKPGVWNALLASPKKEKIKLISFQTKLQIFAWKDINFIFPDSNQGPRCPSWSVWNLEKVKLISFQTETWIWVWKALHVIFQFETTEMMTLTSFFCVNEMKIILGVSNRPFFF